MYISLLKFLFILKIRLFFEKIDEIAKIFRMGKLFAAFAFSNKGTKIIFEKMTWMWQKSAAWVLHFE